MSDRTLKKEQKMKIIILLTALVSQLSFAAEKCVITTQRTACPGKEKEMLKPYKDKNPTVDEKEVKDAAECKAKAESDSKIIRKGTLAGKKITAKYGKESFGPFEDKAECK